MVQLSTPWPLTGDGPPVRRFLSNYFDLLLLLLSLKLLHSKWLRNVTNVEVLENWGLGSCHESDFEINEYIAEIIHERHSTKQQRNHASGASYSLT